MTKQSYFGIIAVIVVLFGLYAFISQHPSGVVDDNAPDNPQASQPKPSSDPPIQPLNPVVINEQWRSLLASADGPAIGNSNAPYSVIEVGDFQCPQCGKMRPVIEELLLQSAGKAKLYFVNMPLRMHAHAFFAAQAALAAGDQGKFWRMYDLLYSHQDELIPSEIQYYAGQDIPGFDTAKYLTDINSPTNKQRVQNQIKAALEVGVTATPTVIVRKTAGGTPSWYIGANDTPTSHGILTLAMSPPWKSQ